MAGCSKFLAIKHPEKIVKLIAIKNIFFSLYRSNLPTINLLVKHNKNVVSNDLQIAQDILTHSINSQKLHRIEIFMTPVCHYRLLSFDSHSLLFQF